MNESQDMNYYLEELKEYKKLNEKLEIELRKYHKEKISLSKENNEMKSLISQLDLENDNIKKEIINLQKDNKEITDINILLKEQINNINSQHQNEIDSLRNINNLLVSNNTSPIENLIEIILKLKNAEINSLKEEILTLTKNNNKLKLDYEEITRKFESELSKNKNNN